MNHDPSSDPADARLSALVRAHLADAGQPSAASDARILALAREAVARPAAKPVASGWRSWLHSNWFGPGLAFATIASLSVVVVSLMPKEEMSAERAITQSPAAPTLPASPAAPVTPASPSSQAAESSGESRAASSVTLESSPQRASDGRSQQQAGTNETVRPLPQRGAPTTPSQSAPEAAGSAASAGSMSPATSARPMAPPASAARAASPASPAAAVPPPSSGKAIAQRTEVMPSPAPRAERPNPFPAQSPPSVTQRADQAAAASAPRVTPGSAGAADGEPTQRLERPPAPAAAAAADAGATQRLEKPSLFSEPTESQMSASPPIPEVHDSAPTYANEPQPAVAPPHPYARPRVPARDAAAAPGFAAPAPGLAAPAGSLASKAAAQKDISAQRRADRSASPTAAAQAMAPAPPLRDPAEWIKAIQKLRTEGKSEQVTKELAEFRRQYPLYPLPEELKQLK